MVYPGAGIPNSTGSAWGTSYGVTGTGSVVLSDSPTFTTAITSTGALQLTGSDTVAQNIATDQTSGTLTIGGATGTGTITLGRSTAAQTVGIATGINTSATKTVNIGTGSTGGTTNINIGVGVNCTIGLTGSITLAGSITTTAVSNPIDIGNAQVAGALTIGGTAQTGAITLGKSTVNQTTNIQAGATASGRTKTISIGTGGLAGSTSNITIGSTSGTSTTTVNGLLKQQTYTVATLPAGSAGSRSFVTDHTSALAYPIFGEVVSTIGLNGPFNVPVFHDGTNWRVG
jgi:hypothetical protein